MRTFHAAAAPHLPSKRTVRGVMSQVLLALVPGIAVHAWLFGPGIFVQIVIASGFALAFEAALLRLRGRPLAPFLTDGSAVVAASLFALCIPPLAPWWIAAVAMFFAIVIAKHCFGGLGHNVFNPAMVGYVVVLISFPLQLTRWPLPRELSSGTPGLDATLQAILGGRVIAPDGIDALTGATPLDAIRTGLAEGRPLDTVLQSPVFGAVGGTGWEWLAAAFGIGGLYLLWRGIIRWQVPVATLGSVLVMALVAWVLNPETYPSAVLHCLSGGLVLGAFFIATDPVSGCASGRGRLVFGAGVGVLTLVIRYWGGYPDGVAFAVLLMNMAAPLVDRVTRPRVYGT